MEILFYNRYSSFTGGYVTKQNHPWGPKELTEKLITLTNEGKILWRIASWGFRVYVATGLISNDVVIDLERKEGDSGSEIPYVPPVANTSMRCL